MTSVLLFVYTLRSSGRGCRSRTSPDAGAAHHVAREPRLLLFTALHLHLLLQLHTVAVHLDLGFWLSFLFLLSLCFFWVGKVFF